MKTIYTVVVVFGFLLAGCGPSADQLTATAVMARAQTQTAAPTLTPTFTPTVTLTPTPTVTLTPTPKPTSTATPTPSSLGSVVKLDFMPLEVTVLWSQTHTHIVPGGQYYYYAESGRTFIELGVLVRNTGTKPLKLKINNFALIDADGKSHTAGFSASKIVDIDQRFDPAGIKIPNDPNKGEEEVTIDKDTYLRLIFYVKAAKTFTFRVLNSPLIVFDIK